MPESGLSDKTMVMVVGPTAIGKSAIMNKVIELDDRFGRVGGFTTRPRRSNDEKGLYRYISAEDARSLITQGKPVQYAVNPANDQVYGTEAGDYASEFNMKDTLSGAVENFMSLPFKKHIIVSVTAPVDAWKSWLDTRFPEPSADRTRRLIEAKQSIEWSLAQTQNHTWVINEPHELESTARHLIDHVSGATTHEVTEEPVKMLALINDLLSYE